MHEPFNGGRHAHAAESGACVDGHVALTPSMEGGMRMPPNPDHVTPIGDVGCHPSMEGGMRMPPNW